jgi:Zn-dependent M28 family amino/carboxypeptidase
MFNRDGAPTVPTAVSVPQAMMADFEKICKPINDIDPKFPFKVNVVPPRNRPAVGSGTDAGAFLAAGVPVVYLNTEDISGHDFSYREIWHTTRDTYEKCPKEYMDHASIVTAIVVYGVANLDHLLSKDGYFREK